MSKRNTIVIISCILLCAALGTAVFVQRNRLSASTFKQEFRLRNPIAVGIDAADNVYCLDNKFLRILKIDPHGKLIYSIDFDPREGGEDRYGYFSEIAVDPEGRLYTVKVVYFLESGMIDYESIERFSPEGKRDRILHKTVHDKDTKAYDSRYLTLQIKDGYMYFDFRSQDTVLLQRVPLDGGKVDSLGVIPAGKSELYNLAGTQPGDIFVTSFSGDTIYRFTSESRLEKHTFTGISPEVPPIVYADKLFRGKDGTLFITDLFNQCVYSSKDEKTLELYLTKRNIESGGYLIDKALFKDIWVNDSGRMAVIEQISERIFTLDAQGKVLSSVGTIRKSAAMLFSDLWVLVFALLFLIVFFFLLIFTYRNILLGRIPLLFKLVLAFVPLFILIISYISQATFQNMYERYLEEVGHRLQALAQMGARVVDSEAVKRLNVPGDYMNGDYKLVQNQLDNLLNSGKDAWNKRIYANVDKYFNNMFYIVTDNAGTYGVLYPHIRTPEAYMKALSTGEAQLAEFTDQDGTYIEAVMAIHDKNGAAVGTISVGSSKDDFDKLHDLYIGKLIRQIAAAAGIFIVLIVGVTFFILSGINLLRGAVKRMAGGEFEVNVDIRSRDEIGELGQGFNIMSRYIHSYIDEITNLSESYARFVPKEFLRYLEKKSIIDIELGNQVEIDMTVLFSDIRSFSTISEKMTPQENFNFLNSYLGRISPVIRRHNGFIDKFIGDAIMALFPGSPSDGLLAALEMREILREYNRHRSNCEYPPVEIGVGLHTGRVMLGILGEKERMDGTVISDAVNVASRLEGLTKLYGAKIIISESILRSVKEKMNFSYRYLAKVIVKGRTDPVSIFDVFQQDEPDKFALKERTRDDFEMAVKIFESEEYDKAIDSFKKISDIFPEDSASHHYIQKCHEVLKDCVDRNS